VLIAAAAIHNGKLNRDDEHCAFAADAESMARPAANSAGVAARMCFSPRGADPVQFIWGNIAGRELIQPADLTSGPATQVH
jgi:hypothetical protein